MTLTVGLVGTGNWAETVHAPSLATSPDVDFVGVWGRRASERERLAAAHAVRAFDSLEQLIGSVDIVDFAVPPAVQLDAALTAADAGRHLLLEKPIALDVADATRLVDAVERNQVAAVVFVTRLFEAARVAWLTDAAAHGWTEARVDWLSGALVAGGRLDDSLWRHEAGALWDLGPHVLSQLEPVLGRVDDVRILDQDPSGLIELEFHHESGALSTARLTLHGDPDAYVERVTFGAGSESTTWDGRPTDYIAAHRSALRALVAQALDTAPSVARADGYSVFAGLGTVEILSAAQALLTPESRPAASIEMGG